jgi:hypothetical protein
MRKIFLLTLTALAFSLPVSAQQYDSSYKDWSVYTHRGSCYIGSAPVKQSGNYSRRGQPYILVVYRSKDLAEINISSGYPYKKKSDVKVTIDDDAYKLFTEKETAWAYDSGQDRKMVDAMMQGTRLTVRGTSQIGTWSEDQYSLMGFTAAITRMKSLCK